MTGTLQLSAPAPLSWSCRRHHHQRLRGRQPSPQRPLMVITRCALSKHGHRFLTSLATVAAGRDPSATNRLIRKFVASSPKQISLNALSHLLSPENTTYSNLSSLALPLYLGISEASWFKWNTKLVAELVALLDKQGLYHESETLISDAVSKLECKERDLAQFYCCLINFHSKHKSKRGFDDSCSRLSQLLYGSSSNYVKRQAYESLIVGLCVMDQPREAENLIEEMRVKGLKPPLFHFNSLVYAYGRLGFFEDMLRSVHKLETEGFAVDTVCSNMVLSSYGAHNKLAEMVTWLQKMKSLGISFSIRTYNSVLNSCPMIMSLMQDLHNIPVSMEELIKILSADEALLVKELVGSSVLECVMEWSSVEAKLDLHGMHLGSAYLIMLQWMEEMKYRLHSGNHEIPAEVTVICGAGKHSNVRGESPVKDMVKKMLIRTSSPMRIDRNNIGCFVAKGKVVKNWLCSAAMIT